MTQEIDVDTFTRPFQLTSTLHRQPYDAISPSNPANAQTGKLVLITGAGSGIGAAAARVWARAGAQGIVLVGRRLERLHAVAQTLQSEKPGLDVVPMAADMASDEDMKSLFTRIKDGFGRAPDVIVSSASSPGPGTPILEAETDQWWNAFETNTRGIHALVRQWVKSQADPAKPVGTLVWLSGGGESLTLPGASAGSISKLAAHRVVEYIQAEHPTLRTFSLLPGLVPTEGLRKTLAPYALDHEELSGMVSLWLVQPKADFLKGQLVSVNWDVTELEQHAQEIEDKGLLKLSWIPALPVSGGKGLVA